MTTAQTLIDDALSELHVLEAGDSANANDTATGLRYLNRMLQGWSTQNAIVYYQKEIAHVLDGSIEYTIGTGGDIAESRPNYIISAYATQSGEDWPVEVIRDKAQFDKIYDKTITGIPDYLYYQPEYPLGKLRIWPVGDASTTLHFSSRAILQQFSTANDTVSLPDGYEDAIVFNLAVRLASSFGQQPSAFLMKNAAETLAFIKRNNAEDPIMEYDCSLPNRPHFDISRGY